MRSKPVPTRLATLAPSSRIDVATRPLSSRVASYPSLFRGEATDARPDPPDECRGGCVPAREHGELPRSQERGDRADDHADN